MASKNIKIDSAFRDDLYLKKIYERDGSSVKDGIADGKVSFEELRGTTIETPTGALIVQTEQDFQAVTKAVSYYQDYSKKNFVGVLLQKNQARSQWRLAWKTYFRFKDPVSRGSWLVGKPLLGVDQIEIPLNFADEESRTAKLVFKANPRDSFFELSEDGEAQSLTTVEMNQELPNFIDNVVVVLNQTLQDLNLPQTMRENLRRLLLDNYDFVLSSPQTSDPIAKLNQARADNRVVTNGFNAALYEYPVQKEVAWKGGTISTLSSTELDQDNWERISELLNNLPEPLVRFFQSVNFYNPREDATLVILSDDEYERMPIGLTSGAMYVSIDHRIYLKKSSLESLYRLDEQAGFDHEFCHLVFDQMCSDSYMETAIKMLSNYFPARTSPYAEVATLVSPTFLVIPLPLPSFLAVHAGIDGAVALDYTTHFRPDSDGLLGREFQSLQARALAGVSPQRLTVSSYSLVGNHGGELAADTLLAYCQSKEELISNGVFMSGDLEGPLSREELMEKNPAIYLAYEVFFATDSPQHNYPLIFVLPQLIDILDAALAHHKNQDGTYDLKAARQELFKTLPRIEPFSGDGAYPE
jgi:hypothetical protein